VKLHDFEKGASVKNEEDRIRKLHESLYAKWRENQQKDTPVVLEDDVAYTVSKITGIPLAKLEEKESEKLLRMEEELHKRVIAQDEAVKAIAKAIRRSRAGLKARKRPIGSFSRTMGCTNSNNPSVVNCRTSHFFYTSLGTCRCKTIQTRTSCNTLFFCLNISDDSWINDTLLSTCDFPREFVEYVHKISPTYMSIKRIFIEDIAMPFRMFFTDEEWSKFLKKVDEAFENFRTATRPERLAIMFRLLEELALKAGVAIQELLKKLGEKLDDLPRSCPGGCPIRGKIPVPEEFGGKCPGCPPAAPETESKREKVEATRRGIEGARKAGYSPGGLIEEVERKEAKLLMWPEELFKRIYIGTRIIPTWRGVPRRWLPVIKTLEKIGIFAPRYKPEEVTGRVVFVLDVSGSISTVELEIFLGAVNDGIKRVKPREYWVITFDAEVQDVYSFKYPQMLPEKVKVTGRGGTMFIPPLKYILENIPQPDVVVFFTDMCNFDDRKEVKKLIERGAWKHIWAIPKSPGICLEEWKKQDVLIGEVIEVVPLR